MRLRVFGRELQMWHGERGSASRGLPSRLMRHFPMERMIQCRLGRARLVLLSSRTSQGCWSRGVKFRGEEAYNILVFD